ncbi:MAG: rhomboid family intramembrane serine protease [Armatimonadota bacterium]|nr:rhomboid family intramembrane serine protease [Armatimonadota bacterium]
MPIVNYIIIAANVAAYIYEVSLGADLERFIKEVAVVPAEYIGFLSGYNVPLQKLLTAPFASMFLHGGFLHLIGNMWFLYIFGDNVEDRMGHLRYFLFYLFCGLAATAAHILISPTSPIPIIGASGAISGVLGAYLALFPRASILTLVFFFYFFEIVEIPALVYLGLWFVIQLNSGILQTLLSPSEVQGGVAWWAHIGGFVAGLVLQRLFREEPRAPRYKELFYPF